MTTLVFEQPLNEKVRSYLRLEYLHDQLQQNLVQDLQHRCFEPLFSLCELCERCDYRSDVVKDLDKMLLSASAADALKPLSAAQVNELQQLREQLKQSARLTEQIKQNRFLTALRQRFNMPGASCNFDLPQLHYWLSQPFAHRATEYQQWIAAFMPLLRSIKILLTHARDSAEFEPHTAQAGFYQGQAQHSLSLVRVSLKDQNCYPTISGNRNRYAIHFVDFSTQKHTDRKIEFQLATC